MLSPRGCVSPYLGRGPVRDMSLPNEWGQAPFVPQGHCFEGGSGPLGQGCPSSDGRQGGHRLRTLPLLKVGGGGGQPAWPCHCWSERERAARDRELSEFKRETRRTETGWGGGGKPPGGQSRRQPDRTGPRPQRLPPSQPAGLSGPRDLSSPRPSQACARGPLGGGGSALPREWTHGGGGGNWRGTRGDYLPEE